MTVRRLADGLRFPEGPTPLPDGRIAFVQCYGGCISTWTPATGAVNLLVDLGGAPNSTVLGPGGSLYVTQNGGKVGPWRAPVQSVPSIQIVSADGHVEFFVTEVDGTKLSAPNDLVFGRDGLLYFTDPAEGYTPEKPATPGRVFAVDLAGNGRVIAETGPAYPNGIAAERDGSVVWVESYTRAVRRYRDGEVRTIAVVPEASVPDGLKLDVDGNLYITGTRSGGIDVLASDGRYLKFIACGAVPTNCAFVENTLYVTDGGHTGLTMDPGAPIGALWAVDVDALGALPFPPAA